MNRMLIGSLFAFLLVVTGATRAAEIDNLAERGASSPFNQVIKELNRVICDKVDAVQEQVCDILDTVTSSCSRTVIAAAPFTIEESGSYCLAANLAGTVTIAASNVTLDLNGYAIDSGASDALLVDATATTTGIVIKNGFLFTTERGITRTGSELIANLSVECLVITADTGIYLDSNIKNSLIDNCVITADYAGIFLGADSSLVSNCVISLSTLGGTRGIFILPDCKNAKFVNCLVEGGLIGFDGSSSDGPLVFDHCVTCSSRSVGFSFNGDVKGVELLKCSAMYGQGDGFLLDNSATDFVFRDCSSMKNKDGFVFSENVSNVVLSGCVALGNMDDGFLLDDSTVMNLVFHECEAGYNGSNGFDLSAATGAGHRVQECRSMTNTGTGFSDATPANATYVSNFASGNAFEFTPSIPDVVTSAGAATSYWENVAI